MDHFNRLPSDVTWDILSRLPAESVLECKLVSKTWNTLIHQPSFFKLHANRLDADLGKLGFLASMGDSHDYKFHYFEFDESTASPIQIIRKIHFNPSFQYARFVSSCNGLICFASGQLVWICNPITREQVTLPKIIKDYDIHESRYWTIGFGYVSSTDEYKIVGIYTAETEFVLVYVYNLGSGNGWRNVGKFNFKSDRAWDLAHAFANGVLYWLDNRDKIISFDLAEEKFCEPISLPPNRWNYGMGVLDGFLYLAARISCGFDIWLRTLNQEKKEQEEHQSFGWSKEFTIKDNKLLAFTKSDGVLTYGLHYLKIYDTKTSTLKSLVKFRVWLSHVAHHRNTFVSLKVLGEEDTKTMEKVTIEETKSPDYYTFIKPCRDARPEYMYL